MANNAQAICASFKAEMLAGVHNIGGPDTLKAALYYAGSSLGALTTSYSATGEVGGTNYTAGGIVVPNASGIQQFSTTAFWTPSNNLVYTNVTIASPFDCVLIYNSSKSNRAIAVYTFTAQTLSAATFTITMPANVFSSALIQVN